MSDHWNQQFPRDFRRFWIGPMHIMSRLFEICMQFSSVPVKTTAVLCVPFTVWRTYWQQRWLLWGTASGKEMCQREHLIMKNLVSCRRGKYSPENMEVYLGLMSHTQKLKEKKLDLGADQDCSRYNIQFFGFNTNRSAKAYYFRLNYDQWATVGFRLLKTKTPSFLPAGLQKGKKI